MGKSTLTEAQATEAYLEFHSLRKAAKELGVSVATVRRRLDGGVVGPPGVDDRPKPLPWKRDHTTEAWLWFREHREDRLPHNVDELVKLSGLKRYQINYFLRTRKTEASKYVQSLPQLQEVDTFIQADFGRTLATKAITSLILNIDKFDLSVKVDVLVYGQHHLTATIPWLKYLEIVQPSTEASTTSK